MKCSKKWVCGIATACVVVAGLLFFIPSSDGCRRGNVMMARTVSWYELPVPDADTLYFTGLASDSSLAGLSTSSGKARSEYLSNAFFISYSGRVATAADTVYHPDSVVWDALLPALQKEAGRLEVKSRYYREMLDEMAYYKRTHSVADEGFHRVMDYRERLTAELAEAERLSAGIGKVLAGAEGVARLHREHEVYCVQHEDSVARVVAYPCRWLAENENGAAVWQTRCGMLPPSAARFRLNPFPYTCFHTRNHQYAVWGRFGKPQQDMLADTAQADMFKVRMAGGQPEIPLVEGADGALVSGGWGCLNGMTVRGRLVSACELYALQWKRTSWHAAFWEDLKAWWHRVGGKKTSGRGQTESLHRDYDTFQREDTTYYGMLADSLPGGEGVMRYPDGSLYSGKWLRGKKHGYGEMTDTIGRRYVGVWRADSLQDGECRDGSGVYRGSFNRGLEAQGQGEYTTADGHYYTGEWTNGLRDGFGFAVAPHEVLKCGVWREGRFKGEQMLYTSRRVYGIDISKYQHVVGRRVYPIDWKRLRITHLGHISRKKIEGEVDYPVSFVYIKATEGLTVTNPYYLRDAAATRRFGYPVGAYHFFSTRPAARQASFFLKKAALKKGDLPPMLDVELTDRQIKAMGGAEALFSEMLVWLRTVSRHSHATPIIYIGQEFVNKYMLSAPEELKQYPVWVARYGEYKPYVHLLYWQLSPDGSVRGIRGNVDIDVFNGTAEQFEEYVRTQGVK